MRGKTFLSEKSSGFKSIVDERLVEAINGAIKDYDISDLKKEITNEYFFDDYMTEFRKEKSVIRTAIKEGIIKIIISVASESATTQRTALVSCIDYMHNELGMDYNTVSSVLLAVQSVVNKKILSVRGKSICHQLKEMRRTFAEANGIIFHEEECTYEGPCNGTCPYCDSKTKELINKAEALKQTKEIKYPQTDIKREDLIDSDMIVSVVEGRPILSLGNCGFEDFEIEDMEDLPFA